MFPVKKKSNECIVTSQMIWKHHLREIPVCLSKWGLTLPWHLGYWESYKSFLHTIIKRMKICYPMKKQGSIFCIAVHVSHSFPGYSWLHPGIFSHVKKSIISIPLGGCLIRDYQWISDMSQNCTLPCILVCNPFAQNAFTNSIAAAVLCKTAGLTRIEFDVKISY